jgi:hypothetical protein
MRYYRLYSTTQPESQSEHKEKIWPDRPSVYPDGDAIPESLPKSYQLHQDCDSCAAYNSKTTTCSKYNAMVKPNYWCHSWKGK